MLGGGGPDTSTVWSRMWRSGLVRRRGCPGARWTVLSIGGMSLEPPCLLCLLWRRCLWLWPSLLILCRWVLCRSGRSAGAVAALGGVSVAEGVVRAVFFCGRRLRGRVVRRRRTCMSIRREDG